MQRNCLMAKNGFNNRSKLPQDSSSPELNLAKRLAIKHPASSLSLAKDIYLGGTTQKVDNIDSYETHFAEQILRVLSITHPLLILPILIDIIEFTTSSNDVDYASGVIYRLGKEYPLETAEMIQNALESSPDVSGQLKGYLFSILEGIEAKIEKYSKNEI